MEKQPNNHVDRQIIDDEYSHNLSGCFTTMATIAIIETIITLTLIL